VFIDEVTLSAKAGDGGDGAVAWRREAHVARGGPSGGDGGDGGDVVFIADDNVHSLLDFKYEPELHAKNGQMGRGKNQAGETAADVVAKVPCGTQIFDADSGALLCDLTENDQRFVACKGGNGGFGNTRFATPSRQAPEFAKPGLAGEAKRLRLSLKVMADVGLLGFPNAGKSTFLSRVSAARPKIANYPFTTLVPQLGVVKVDPLNSKKTLVIADIPGVIEGAADGAGLGIRFLKHLERVRVLLHIVEVPLEAVDAGEGAASLGDQATHQVRGPVDLIERYEVLRAELVKFSHALSSLPEVVAVNKIDLLASTKTPMLAKFEKHLKSKRVPLYYMSGASRAGIDEMIFALWNRVVEEKKPPPPPAFDPMRRL
jgi:GTPase